MTDKSHPQGAQLTGLQRIKIAARTLCSERTVRRVYDGGGSDRSRERIQRAALALGLPLPPEPVTESEPEAVPA